ncbi:nuclear transport factor 2 family protein [Sphingobacterium sp.]|uniref:nuclear transport factor 2 family protein n=1 Tax=Sphingobacterium sp. TaxID=341027 RepID=UPI0028B0C599|nr:nuclear transport factor 2 family protein [Sphingobacterium sp.]
MKIYSLVAVFLMFIQVSLAQSEQEVAKVLDQWHAAAGKADFKEYFGLMDANSVFIGTDATERWDKQEFMDYAKPHFDKGKAWNFSSLERNIEISEDGKTAWIDELLNTQMKICRGSGVLVLKDGKWLIKQYVLSMTVPNDLADEVVKMKTDVEDKIIEELKLK